MEVSEKCLRNDNMYQGDVTNQPNIVTVAWIYIILAQRIVEFSLTSHKYLLIWLEFTSYTSPLELLAKNTAFL